jgi:hypothetical protein
MKIVGYITEENDKLYDFNTIRQIVGTTKSKLHRDLHKLDWVEFVKYKNQYLYSEKTLFEIMERLLFERLDKIERAKNGLQES